MSNRGSDDAKRANDEAFVPALQAPIALLSRSDASTVS
jgi:hypothetical protein